MSKLRYILLGAVLILIGMLASTLVMPNTGYLRLKQEDKYSIAKDVINLLNKDDEHIDNTTEVESQNKQENLANVVAKRFQQAVQRRDMVDTFKARYKIRDMSPGRLKKALSRTYGYRALKSHWIYKQIEEYRIKYSIELDDAVFLHLMDTKNNDVDKSNSTMKQLARY